MAHGDLEDPTDYGSTVRNNLMKRPGYSPYCGDGRCRFNMPRTGFRDGQFVCICGWRSEFPDDFIEGYQARWCAPVEA
jgi:hypothetical protein